MSDRMPKFGLCSSPNTSKAIASHSSEAGCLASPAQLSFWVCVCKIPDMKLDFSVNPFYSVWDQEVRPGCMYTNFVALYNLYGSSTILYVIEAYYLEIISSVYHKIPYILSIP